MPKDFSRLHRGFFRDPTNASQVMRSNEFQTLLLRTKGAIIVNGSTWYVKRKKIGPGIFKVYVSTDDHRCPTCGKLI